MKKFSVIDQNKPMQFFVDCIGCVLVPQKHDKVMIITASGNHVDVGIQLPHAISQLLYDKILEAAKTGGTVIIPDIEEMNDDEIRIALSDITITQD